MKRLTAILLAAIMILSLTTAFAETWTCPKCGRTGNRSQFCPDCGEPKPEEQMHISGGDTSTDIKPGDFVYFGRYEQDRNMTNGSDRIRWLVLKVESGKLFLLSEYGLERRRFNERSNGATWADCELRRWLNDSFLWSAFNSSEISAIQTTRVEDGLDQTNPAWNTAGRLGYTTEDRVFLLSYQEMNSLVDSSRRLCAPSDEVRHRGVYTETHDGHLCCWYWLRTSAFRNNAGVVAANGSFETCYIHHEYGVVRPALWVDASAVTK